MLKIVILIECKNDLHIPQNPAISSTSGNNKSNKRKKVEKAFNNDRDIRTLFLNASAKGYTRHFSE